MTLAPNPLASTFPEQHTSGYHYTQEDDSYKATEEKAPAKKSIQTTPDIITENQTDI